MKTIIDSETGELIEVEDQNEIAERKMEETGLLTKEMYEIVASYLYYKDQVETFRYQLQKTMQENDVKKWDNDLFQAVRVAEHIEKRVDVERLKADGLYEKYIKLIPVKEKLNLKFKE